MTDRGRTTMVNTALRSSLVAATALAVLTGAATPAQAGGAITTASASAAREASQWDKVQAAGELGITPGADLMVLGDRNFVFALWQRANTMGINTAEVRASAELALAGSDLECTEWIKNGLHEARGRDQRNEVRDTTAARQARQAKQRAAMVNGIVATPELWLLGDKDFVFEMWRRPSGSLLKAAARTAYDGTAADQQAFIQTGIFTARAADQQAARDADDKADAEQKARQKALDDRTRAAALLGLEMTDSLRVVPDNKFVFTLYNTAKPSSTVATAAAAALQSHDPAKLTAFITTGIYQADQQDEDAFWAQKAKTDRLRAFELRTRADNSRVHPALVAAADAALAGADGDVAKFLTDGQYRDSALVQSLRSPSTDYLGWYVNGTDNATITPADTSSAADSSWRIVPGLADPTCQSLELVGRQHYFLRQKDLRVVLAPTDGTDQFKADATWCTKTGLSGVGAALESFSQRGRFLRHFGADLWVANTSGEHPFDDPAQYAIDASWQIEGPKPTS